MIQSQLYSNIQNAGGNDPHIRYLFMNEAFDNSVGTQRSDMGMFKRFAMNLTTVALPNLIAHDLVIVHPELTGR